MADKIIFLKNINDSVQVGDELYYTNISTGTFVPAEPLSLGGITNIGYNYVEIASGSVLPTIGPLANLLDKGFFTADPTNEWTLGNNVSWVNEAIDFGTPLYSLDIANGTCEDLQGNILQNTNLFIGGVPSGGLDPTYHVSASGPTVYSVFNGVSFPGSNECGYTGDCSEGTLGISYSTCLQAGSGCYITLAELATWTASLSTSLPNAFCGKCESASNAFIQYSTKAICEGLDPTNIWTQNTWTPYVWSLSSNPAVTGENLTQDVTNANLQSNADYIVSFDISNYVSGELLGFLSNDTHFGMFPNSGTIDENGSYVYTVNLSYPVSGTINPSLIEFQNFTEFEGTIDNVKIVDPADPSAFSDLFFMFRKPVAENVSSLKGYFAESTFTNSFTEKQELFAVGSEITISSK